MILPVGKSIQNYSFRAANQDDKKAVETKKAVNDKGMPDNDVLMNNNLSTRARIGMDKLVKAFTVYPARGMTGSINSDFYEFLTMGTVPYIVGSLTLMSIFNSAAKHFPAFDQSSAYKLGNKMALGVVMYALAKSLSKSLVNIPVKYATGVDTQLPYMKVNHQLPVSEDDTDLTSYEYHKVGESVEFTRWDLLYGDPNDKKDLNKRYDKIAKKNGLGTDLNDSDQEVKPIYKEVLVKSGLARSISSYLWAAVGVALAFQKPWEDYFYVATAKFWKPKDFGHSLKILGQSFVRSAKELWTPKNPANKFEKYVGKGVVVVATLSTILGVLNTLHITKKPSKVSDKDVMDKNKESVVG